MATLILLAAQGGETALAGWQIAGLYIGVPAAAFLLIAAVVLRTSAPPERKGAFPVLRPGQPLDNNGESDAATPSDESPDQSEAASEHGAS